MKKLKKVSVSVLVFVLFCSGLVLSHDNDKTNGNNERDPLMFSGLESDAAKVVVDFHRALESADGVLARSLLDDHVVIIEGGGIERSADEYAAHHMMADMKYLSAVHVQTIEHHTEESGNIAVSISRSKTTGSYKGETVDDEGSETVVLRKIAGNWRITHIHWS
jgi:ketosteroid isomerase-like protein